MKNIKRKFRGGTLATVGFILSPLSWWNDPFVNIPLAYLFAFPFGFISENLLFPMMILGYWLTNIIGFMLMHHGYHDLVSKKKGKYTRRELVKDAIISVIYTLIIILLIKMGWIRFPSEFFQ